MLRSLKGLMCHSLKLGRGCALHTARAGLSSVSSQDVPAAKPRAIFHTSESDPAKHTDQHEGRLYSIPLQEVKAVFPHGLPHRFQQQIQTFNEARVMVRRPALEILAYLKGSNLAHPAVRYVIYGERGTGKTMTLCHVVHYCSRQGWLVLHIPDAHLWVKNCKELFHSSYNKDRLDQPLQASVWLKNFKTSNERFLEEVGGCKPHPCPVLLFSCWRKSTLDPSVGMADKNTKKIHLGQKRKHRGGQTFEGSGGAGPGSGQECQRCRGGAAEGAEAAEPPRLLPAPGGRGRRQRALGPDHAEQGGQEPGLSRGADARAQPAEDAEERLEWRCHCDHPQPDWLALQAQLSLHSPGVAGKGGFRCLGPLCAHPGPQLQPEGVRELLRLLPGAEVAAARESAHGGWQSGAAVPQRLQPAAAGPAGGTPIAQ
ncbi:small ribosomal subunit protein mS29 isoform X1 [Molothrus aeneus]|uniref:small ribosomal subunit protein mS29 isoform X1 n=1 Tax=Molothrus aeneus TaxID=84833 RepID=UPI003459116B